MGHLYRQKHGTDIWHWRGDCPDWPMKAYRRIDKPPGEEGRLCRMCQELHDRYYRRDTDRAIDKGAGAQE